MTSTAASPTGMSPARLWLANAVIIGVIAASVVAIAANLELWPFSPFGMFSRLRTAPIVRKTWICGVPAGGGPEIAFGARDYPHPLKPAHARYVLTWLASRPDGRANLEVGLADLLRRYERRRQAGAHAGPRLEALRAYSVEWQRDPEGANRDRPSRTRLLAEVRAPEAP